MIAFFGMKWIRGFELFLFDFDGLLVNTESLHFQAYINIYAKRGFVLNWDFQQYAQAAHIGAESMKEAIYQEFPKLYEREPYWEVLYEEKTAEYIDLIGKSRIEMMSGARKLLEALEKANIRRCVVTNSTKQQTDLIRAKIPVLNTIPHWITAGDCLNKKPHPECYLRAIRLYGEKGDRIIGFEDTLKGLNALRQCPVQAVLICPSHHPQLSTVLSSNFLHFESFDLIPSDAEIR